MKRIYLAMTAVVVAAGTISLAGCSANEEKMNDNTADSVVVADKKNEALREGDLCSVVKDSTGKSFGIVKILKIEDDTYHLRTYGVSYESRPTENDLEDISPNHSAGIGHLPLSRLQFEQWKPEVIINQPVSLEELEGYNTWKTGNK